MNSDPRSFGLTRVRGAASVRVERRRACGAERVSAGERQTAEPLSPLLLLRPRARAEGLGGKGLSARARSPGANLRRLQKVYRPPNLPTRAGSVAGFFVRVFRARREGGFKVNTTQGGNRLLLDHVDARQVTADEGAADRSALVRLDPDHPGFRDAEYRARRNRIAQLALDYRAGVALPDAPYTPEPHVVHELLGRTLTLAGPSLAERNRLVGEAVRRTASAEALERLSRDYWFTIEFGVLREDGEVKAYGTGLLSSAGELEEMSKAELRPLDLEEAARAEYDPTRFQPVLFCADSFDGMYDALKR